MHPAALTDEELLRACDVRRQRRSGPGGQHRNKVETAVVITHRQSRCIGEASERRSQEANRLQAMQRLRIELALGVRTNSPAEHDGQPSPLWRSRLRGGRLHVSPKHADFPSLLAEALDVLTEQQWDLSNAAETLACTKSQLIKFLKLEYRAFEMLNQARRDLGLGDLR